MITTTEMRPSKTTRDSHRDLGHATDHNWRLLASAIVELAISDYFRLEKGIEKLKCKSSLTVKEESRLHRMIAQQSSVENFFDSDWCEMIIDGISDTTLDLGKGELLQIIKRNREASLKKEKIRA